MRKEKVRDGADAFRVRSEDEFEQFAVFYVPLVFSRGLNDSSQEIFLDLRLQPENRVPKRLQTRVHKCLKAMLPSLVRDHLFLK